MDYIHYLAVLFCLIICKNIVLNLNFKLGSAQGGEFLKLSLEILITLKKMSVGQLVTCIH